MISLNFIKGIFIGIAKIIPGFSGAVLMMSFHLYDKAIFAITNFFDDIKKNFMFLLEIGCGIVIGIVLFSKVISYFLDVYYLYTSCVFIGLIMGGLPIIFREISKNKKNILLLMISFFFLLFISFIPVNYIYEIRGNGFDYVIFFFSGILEALGTVLPGVSSTVLLMLIGIYSYYLSTIGNVFSIRLFKQNLSFLLPFSLGMILGIIFISLLVRYLFEYWKEETFSIILGFSFSSLVLLFFKIIFYFSDFYSFVISFFCFVVGFLIGFLV